MDEIFLAVLNRLAELDGISMIDEYHGQLEDYGDDGYPLTYPAILIRDPEAQYDDARRNYQTGTVSITVSLVIDCYHDTHYGSTQEQYVKEHMEKFREVQECLHGFRPQLDHTYTFTPNCETGKLIRQSARVYSVTGGINVYETTFQCKVKEYIDADYEGVMSTGMIADKE